MVTKRAKQPYRPPTQRPDGVWLCNVVDDCTEPAAVQASPEVLPPCSGCDAAGIEIKGNLEQRRGELASIDSREDDIKAAMKRREDAAANEPLQLLDQVELRSITERRRILGEEIEGLEAEHARVVDDHTHPAFACDKHASRLPK